MREFLYNNAEGEHMLLHMCGTLHPCTSYSTLLHVNVTDLEFVGDWHAERLVKVAHNLR